MMCDGCEHRQVARLSRHGPRFECMDFANSKCSCYMYTPAKPLVLVKLDKSDPRPWPASGMLAARSEVADDQSSVKWRLCSKRLKVRHAGKLVNGVTVWWEPEGAGAASHDEP